MYHIKESEKQPMGWNIHSTDELRKLILENPDIPIIVLANEEANTGEFSLMFCTSVHAEIGEYLNCRQEINDEIGFTDRDEFKEAISDQILELTGYDDRSDEWYEQETERIAAEYDPYWQKCILLEVGN